jgi:hypothetical protein
MQGLVAPAEWAWPARRVGPGRRLVVADHDDATHDAAELQSKGLGVGADTRPPRRGSPTSTCVN